MQTADENRRKGNFGVGDKRVYQGSATTIKSEVPPQMIISTVKSFVEQQGIIQNPATAN